MSEGRSADEQRPVAAFTVSLIAGLWMIASAGMMGLGWGGMMGSDYMAGGRGYGGMYTWVWPRGYMHGGLAGAWWSWVGIAAAIIVIVSAVLVYADPRRRQGWGTVLIVVSGVALIAGAGLLPGILGIVGGVLALVWRPSS